MSNLAARARPFGKNITPDTSIFEYGTPINEAATLERWTPILIRHEVNILGVNDVPTIPTRIMVDGVEWLLEVMDPQKNYQVPSTVFARLRATEAEGVPFAYWLWGEEQWAANRPQFSVDTRLVESFPSHMRGTQTSWQSNRQEKIDPILIAVIPTAPNRGIWCSLGAWFH